MSYSDIKQVQNMQIPGIQIRNAQTKQCNVARTRTDVQLASILSCITMLCWILQGGQHRCSVSIDAADGPRKKSKERGKKRHSPQRHFNKHQAMAMHHPSPPTTPVDPKVLTARPRIPGRGKNYGISILGSYRYCHRLPWWPGTGKGPQLLGRGEAVECGHMRAAETDVTERLFGCRTR
jgi:hypothetical protein